MFDVVNGQRHIVHRVLDGRPMKGDSQLLRSCREDVPDISPHGEPVAAVFDNDKVRRLIKLPPISRGEKRAARGCILGRVPSLARLIERCAEWLLPVTGSPDTQAQEHDEQPAS